MGIVSRVKEDFYQPISREHVLLLCALDVDSLCACKILQCMLKVDSVPHTTMPVSGKADLKRAYEEHAGQINSVVLINCGGYLELLELIQPNSPEARFYVVDSSRPFALENVYNQDQIVVVVREEEEVEVPDYDAIYCSDEEDEGSDGEYYDEDTSPRSKRRKSDRDSYETKRQKHLWHRKRDEIIHKYYEFNYHETAASLVLYELACKLNRDSNELVWLAITGLTEQLLHEKIDRERYVTELHKLQPNVLRHNRSDDDARPSSINSMKITYENELRLVLYRHWTLYESLCHSEYTVCKFKVWSQKGHKKLKEFLANMGIPLVQCQHQFAAMDTKYCENLKQLIDESAHLFQLDDMTYASFVARWGYKSQFSASDMVYSCAALMTEVDRPYSQCFLNALEALSRSNVQITKRGLELARLQQVFIVEQVKHLIETRQVFFIGTLMYAFVAEGTPNVKNFGNPLTLLRLARFLREYYLVKTRKARDLPFIVSAPVDIEKGICLMVGVPPHSDDTRRTEFTKAFQHASDRIQAQVSFDYFDGSVIEVKKEERTKLLDTLVSISAV